MNATQQAAGYITSSCPHLVGFSGTDEVYRFLASVALDVDASKTTPLFPGRYKEHVAYALKMVANSHFTSPPAAIASVYLATRFEFYFRILSGKLSADGCWISPQAQSSAIAAIDDSRLTPRLRQRCISRVSLAYKVMKLDQSGTAGQVFEQLDRALFPAPQKAVTGKVIADIGDRIEYGRNAAGHGGLGDISAESIFYGLVTAIVFYNQS